MAYRRRQQSHSHYELQLYIAQKIAAELHFLQDLKTPGEDPALLQYLRQTGRATINAVQDVMDGMAYRFFDYNHTLVQMLSKQDVSPENIRSEGFLAAPHARRLVYPGPPPPADPVLPHVGALVRHATRTVHAPTLSNRIEGIEGMSDE